MSLKKVRDQLRIGHIEGLINNEELILQHDFNMSNNLDLLEQSTNLIYSKSSTVVQTSN